MRRPEWLRPEKPCLESVPDRHRPETRIFARQRRMRRNGKARICSKWRVERACIIADAGVGHAERSALRQAVVVAQCPHSGAVLHYSCFVVTSLREVAANPVRAPAVL